MFILLILLLDLNAEIKRISKINFNKTEVGQIYMRSGLITKLKFPCSVDEINVGRKKDLKVEFSPNASDIVNISFTSKNKIPTNLIVNCNKTSMIFDVIPSNNHQDLVEITNINGFISNYKVLDSSTDKVKTSKPNGLKKELIVSNKKPIRKYTKKELIKSTPRAVKIEKKLLRSSNND